MFSHVAGIFLYRIRGRCERSSVVEHHLAKVGSRVESRRSLREAGVAELADAQDLKILRLVTIVPVRFRSSAYNDEHP